MDGAPRAAGSIVAGELNGLLQKKMYSKKLIPEPVSKSGEVTCGDSIGFPQRLDTSQQV
jgi:hypothetical protein